HNTNMAPAKPPVQKEARRAGGRRKERPAEPQQEALAYTEVGLESFNLPPLSGDDADLSDASAAAGEGDLLAKPDTPSLAQEETAATGEDRAGHDLAAAALSDDGLSFSENDSAMEASDIDNADSGEGAMEFS